VGEGAGTQPSREAGATGVLPVDGSADVVADAASDAPPERPAICEIPDGSYCGCQEVNQLVSLESDGGPESCRFTLPECAEYRPEISVFFIEGDVRESLPFLLSTDQCADGDYYYILDRYPLQVVLCSATCEALRARGVTTLRFAQGCPALPCVR